MAMEYLSKNEDDTKQIAAQFSKQLKGGDVVAFLGGLGTGKTFFIREILRNIGIKEKIQSPSFVLRKNYRKDNLNFDHFDLYRLRPKDLESTGIFEVLGRKNRICFIEWSEKIKDKLPQKTIFIEIFHQGQNKRKIVIYSSDGKTNKNEK